MRVGIAGWYTNEREKGMKTKRTLMIVWVLCLLTIALVGIGQVAGQQQALVLPQVATYPPRVVPL